LTDPQSTILHSWERAIVELKARGLLGDVDVDRSFREDGGYRERGASSRS